MKRFIAMISLARTKMKVELGPVLTNSVTYLVMKVETDAIVGK